MLISVVVRVQRCCLKMALIMGPVSFSKGRERRPIKTVAFARTIRLTTVRVILQIDFEEKNSDSGDHGCEARDPVLLGAPAQMLGVPPKELGHHLTHRYIIYMVSISRYGRVMSFSGDVFFE